MKCLSGQIGTAAGALLKFKSRVKNIPAFRTGAFALIGHAELTTAGRAVIFGKDYLKVVVPYFGLITLDPPKNATDFVDQWINQFNRNFFHRFSP